MQKIWFRTVYKTFKNLLQNYSPEFLDITHKIPLVFVIKVCLNGGATYIIGKIMAKDNVNIAN